MTATGTGTPRKFLLHRAALFAALVLGLLALVYVYWQYEGEPRFLRVAKAEFVGQFPTPPVANSDLTRHELDEMIRTQKQRTPDMVDAARADRKTEVWQFAAAIGLQREKMRELYTLADLAEQIENDVRPYVRAAKYRFMRQRPYEVETQLYPCIDDVRGDLSYPSGHATYGYVMAYLLADMVPERRAELMARAEEFAHQRMVCGVHFPSDLAAGRLGAEWLAKRFLQSPEYRSAAEPAAHELRAAMGLAR